MASSPPAPIHVNLPNPKKRPSIAHSVTSQSSKRLKLHPLRQTSFPVNGDSSATYSASARSETGSVANSLVSGVSSKQGGKRGRPRKNNRQSTVKLDDDGDAGPSTGASGGGARASIRGGRGTKSIVSARSAENAEEEDEDDQDDMLGSFNEQDRARRAEEAKLEAQRMDRLTSAFTREQEYRHEKWRISKFNPAVMRRIVNQTVSQSVPKTPLLAVSIYTKYFTGEIIERAREVQIEWAKAFELAEEAEAKTLAVQTEDADARLVRREPDDKTTLQGPKPPASRTPNIHKGGLLPDHLREALRRYKADGEGGGVGYGSLSHGLIGAQGAGTWRVGQGNGGKRLLR